MATFAVQQALITGLEETYGACAGGGDEFPNDGNTFVIVKNGHSSPQTVTVVSQVAEADLPPGTDQANVAIAVTNAEQRIIGPFSQNGFNDVDGMVQLTYSGVTALTIAVVTLNQ